jgi:hypothetical protein
MKNNNLNLNIFIITPYMLQSYESHTKIMLALVMYHGFTFGIVKVVKVYSPLSSCPQQTLHCETDA